MTIRRHLAATAILGAGMAGGFPPPEAGGAEPRDTIKSQKYETQAIPYRDEGRDDPFDPKVPLKTVRSRDRWKVRIGGLRLTSVVAGRRRVALFTEELGLSYSYVLVDNALIGPDHRPIPGIAGSIEPMGSSGSFRVTLRQGTEKVEHTFIRIDEDVRRRADELRRRKVRETERRPGTAGGSAALQSESTMGGDRR